MQIRLCDGDRQLFGVDEWLEFDPLNISIEDLDVLSEWFEFDPMDWPEPLFGTITLENAGDGARPVPPRWQPQAAAWMVLRQAGLDVSLDDARKAHWLKAKSRQSPGKESAPSPESGPSTTPPSESSSTSPRKKSTD